jgi:hypothetical protein
LLVFVLIVIVVVRAVRRSSGSSTKQPSTVYLVEDHTDQTRTTYTAYWAHVYLSRERAKADVDEFAARGGHGSVHWEDRSTVLYALPDTDRTNELYRVVPLSVWPDNKVLP